MWFGFGYYASLPRVGKRGFNAKPLWPLYLQGELLGKNFQFGLLETRDYDRLRGSNVSLGKTIVWVSTT